MKNNDTDPAELVCCQCCGTDTRNKSRICAKCYGDKHSEDWTTRIEANHSATRIMTEHPNQSWAELYENGNDIDDDRDAFELLVDMAIHD